MILVKKDEGRKIKISDGVDLWEIFGKPGPGVETSLSISRTKMHKNATMQAHFHRRTTEFYAVIGGEGVMQVDGKDYPVGVGDVLCIKTGEVHTISTGAHSAIEFYAICQPAYDPEDYVPA